MWEQKEWDDRKNGGTERIEEPKEWGNIYR